MPVKDLTGVCKGLMLRIPTFPGALLTLDHISLTEYIHLVFYSVYHAKLYTISCIQYPNSNVYTHFRSRTTLAGGIDMYVQVTRVGSYALEIA